MLSWMGWKDVVFATERGSIHSPCPSLLSVGAVGSLCMRASSDR